PERVWPHLQHSPDPRVRSYLIHHLARLGADASLLVKRLHEEPDLTIRRALVLCLGEYGEGSWSSRDRDVLVEKMQAVYQTVTDPGLHAAAEWLLRRPPWNQQEWLRQTNEAWAKDKRRREKRQEYIKQVVAKEGGKATPQWYVNGE